MLSVINDLLDLQCLDVQSWNAGYILKFANNAECRIRVEYMGEKTFNQFWLVGSKICFYDSVGWILTDWLVSVKEQW